MEPYLTILVRERAYELADTGEFKSWREISDAIIAEGGDALVTLHLNGEPYLKFRLSQRIRAARTRRDA